VDHGNDQLSVISFQQNLNPQQISLEIWLETKSPSNRIQETNQAH